MSLSPPPHALLDGTGAGIFPASGNRRPWKDRLRVLSDRLAVHLARPAWRLWGNRLPEAFGIFMYHRIAPAPPGFRPPTWNVPPPRLRAQLEGLLARGFTAWPLRRAFETHVRGESIPRNVFVVTFDDGYESVYTCAWPILRELRIPATVFVVTGVLESDRPMPFDDWPDAGAPGVPPSSWRPLTRDQCLEMLREGTIDIGCHMHRHEDYRGRPEAFRRDVETSLKIMREVFGGARPCFAFPYGLFDEAMVAIVKEADMPCALTVERQLVTPEQDPCLWGRFPAEGADTAASLAAKLSGWYSWFRNVRRGLSSVR